MAGTATVVTPTRGPHVPRPGACSLPTSHCATIRTARLRGGFTAEDLTGAGSDRLIDELSAWGKPDEIAARLTAHHRAGADRIAVQVVTDRLDILARRAWRDLAPEPLSSWAVRCGYRILGQTCACFPTEKGWRAR